MKKPKGHGVRAGCLRERPFRAEKRLWKDREMPLQERDAPLRNVPGDIAVVRDNTGTVVAFRGVDPGGSGRQLYMPLEGYGYPDLEWRWNGDFDKPTITPLIDEYREMRGYEGASKEERDAIDKYIEHLTSLVDADGIVNGVWR